MNGTELNLDFSSKMPEILNARGKAMLENFARAARRENVPAEARAAASGGRFNQRRIQGAVGRVG
jgi:DNA invertase Pin-like site-specific DNA recombinase